MRISGFLAVLAVFTMAFGSAAHASFWDLFFVPDTPNFKQPYYQDAKMPNNAQWEHDQWKPEYWTYNAGGQKAMIDNLYRAEIITDQYDEDDIPVLEVGKGFFRLSDLDKRRVAAYVDDVYRITADGGPGLFHLYHWKTCEPIGAYAKTGLQLQ